MNKKIVTIKEYAAMRNITTQAVGQLKSVKIIELPLFAEHEGVRVEVGKRKFVEI